MKESREIETLYLYRNSKLNYTGVFSETMNLEESEVKYLKFWKIFASKSMFRDMILQNWKRNDFLSQNKAEGINYQQTYTCRKEIKRNSPDKRKTVYVRKLDLLKKSVGEQKNED